MSTIAAVSTALGHGAIGIVRISGPLSHTLLTSLVRLRAAADFRPWVLHRARFLSRDGSFLDDVLAVYMPGPKTYTGEDMGEVHCHGSPFILETVLGRLFELGARPAERGEFTKRAFLNGRMDLSQAEAVGELVASVSEEALKNSVRRLDGSLSRKMEELRAETDRIRCELVCAIDVPDEEIDDLDRSDLTQQLLGLEAAISTLLAGTERGRLMQEGALVVLTGAVNAGKSSLMNALLGRGRALVSAHPGTTRDFLEELCLIDGMPVRLTDTAGLRAGNDDVEEVEHLGIELTRARNDAADCLLLVLDGCLWTDEMLKSPVCPDPRYAEYLDGRRKVILVWNKADLAEPGLFPPVWAKGCASCVVSAATGEGLDTLSRLLANVLLDERGLMASERVSCNVRQASALRRAADELCALREDVERNVPLDLCAVRMDLVAQALGEVIGVSTSEDVLNAVFARFCIGK